MRVVEYSRKDCCLVDSILYFSCSPLSVMDEFSLHFVSLPTQNKTLHLVVVIVCSDSHSNDDGDRHYILYILLYHVQIYFNLNQTCNSSRLNIIKFW